MNKRTIAIILSIVGMVFVVAGQTVGQTLQYIENDKTVRTSQVDLESASFSGNRITEVNGTASITNEKGDFIAKGNLVVVEGWIALQGLKGSKFKLIPQLDIDAKSAERWYGEPSKELAVVTLGSDQQWELKDDRFFFLIDSSYGLQVDFSSSFARATKLIVTDQFELTLWGNEILIGEGGGIIHIVRGEIIGGKNSLVIKKVNKDTVLITEGFPYRKDIELDYRIEIMNIDKGVFIPAEKSVVPMEMMGMVYGIEGLAFIPICTAAKEEEARKSSLTDAVGVIWVFTKLGISFSCGNHVLKSKVKGATIKFTKEGVLVKGFDILKK